MPEEQEEMSILRQRILRVTGKDLPLAGGSGRNEGFPVVILEQNGNAVADIEHQVLDFFSDTSDQKYVILKQKRYCKENTWFDEMIVQWEGDDSTSLWYFDVTASHHSFFR